MELTSRCNARCGFCYNSTRVSDELSPSSTISLLDKAIDEIGPYHISFSGGEPLLRSDLPKLVSYVKDRAIKATIVTNGILLSRDKVRQLTDAGVDLFQVTLLSPDREKHDRLEGGPFFEKVVSAIADLVNEGSQVSTSFVATAENILAFDRTLELNVLLRVKQVQFCRFNAGGFGLRGWRELMPSPDDVQEALHCASRVASKYPIAVHASVPILPCLVDYDSLHGVSTGFCAVGDPEYPVLALDPTGNLKVCPHSAQSLGSVLERPIPELLRSPAYEEFLQSVPPFCADCPHVTVCRGGCRSAAHVCFGNHSEEDPFLALWKEKAVENRSRPDFARRSIAGKPCAV